MSDSDKTTEYTITANPAGFEAGMDKVVSASRNAQRQIETHINSIGSAFGKLTGMIGTVTAILAGGAAFGAAIAATKEWNGEVGALARQLGINTEQASAMNVALRHLGIDQQTVTNAVDKLTHSMASNAQAFEVLGVETKDVNGAWRSTGEVLPEVMDKLRGIHNITQQNIAGQQIFGKGWSEVKGMLKLTSAELENARQKVKDLHLETDPSKIKEYKTSMNDLKLITTSLEVQMGNALLPVLAQVGKYLGEEGPVMGQVFARVLQTIAASGMTVWEVLKAVGKTIGAVAAAATEAAHGNFSGAKAVLKDIVDENVSSVDRIKNIWAHAYDEAKPAAHGGDADGGGPALGFKDKDEKDHSRMGKWEERLAIEKDGFEREQQLAGTMQDYGKQRERDYWKNLLDTVSMSQEERIQVNRRYLSLEHDLRQAGFESYIAGEKATLEQFKHNYAQRIEIATQIYNELKAKYGADSKEAKEALGEISKEQRKLAEQTLEVNRTVAESARNAALARVDFEQQDAQQQLQLRQITTEKMLEMEQGFEMRRYEIKMQALRDEEAMYAASPDRDPVAMAKLHAQIEDLERQHQMRLAEIRNKATLEQNKNITGMYSSMESGLQRVVAGTLQGTMKLRDIFRNLFDVVASAVIEMLSKTAAQWAMNLVLEKALGKAAAISQIAANAGIAGAAATASAAAIPMIGWAIAPEAGAAASAAAMAYMPMASARGGFDIPSGLNPVTQLHEKEMVLPSKHADVIRDLADNGGAASSPQIHIHAADSHDVRRLFENHGSALVAALKKQGRNFAQ